MGWSKSNLRSSRSLVNVYGDEVGTTVSLPLDGYERSAYEYDFADSWVQDVIVDGTTRSLLGLKYAVCLVGRVPALRRAVAPPGRSTLSPSAVPLSLALRRILCPSTFGKAGSRGAPDLRNRDKRHDARSLIS